MNYVSEPSTIGQQHSSSLLKAAGRDFDLTQSLRTFWRRKNLFAGIVALLMTLAVVGMSAITPLYTAKTDLIIENREQKVAELKAVLGDIMPDKEGLLSELEVIQSRTIAEQVIQQLRLANDPEFNDALKPTGMLATLIADGEQALMSYLPETVLAFLTRNDKLLPTEEERRAREYEKVVDAFLERLGVSVKGQSRAIVIYFTSKSPDKAARIANALADAYIVAQLDAKLEATRRANQWLSVKLQDLRKQVAQSEGAVEEYRRRAGLLQSKEGTLISQQVTNLNAQLIVARTERAAADARLDQVRQMVRAAGNAQAAADVLGSPTIQELSRQETEIKRKIADLSQEMGDRHPRLISARAELKDVVSKIGAEVNKVVQKLESEAGVARARSGAAAEHPAAREQAWPSERVGGAVARVGARVGCQQDAAAAVLVAFRGDHRAIGSRRNADERAHPVEGGRAGKALRAEEAAAAVADLLRRLSTGDGDRAAGREHGSWLPLRGPDRTEHGRTHARARPRRAGGPQGFVVKNPSSLFGESIRSVYTSILISHAKRAPKTVLLTSSQPKEGKSTLAGCLTRICAISGKRAVLVEADLRKPHVHRLLGVPQSPGLTEFYRGEARLQEILHEDKATGAFVIPSGRLVVLGSAQMRELLAYLAGEFDLVLVDSPPLMAVSDARLLAPEMDATIFVVRWGKTHREVVRLRELLDTGASLGGVVLSMVDPNKHARSVSEIRATTTRGSNPTTRHEAC